MVPSNFARTLERELAQARKDLDEARSHMNLARLEAQCPDDETLVMHCRELRSNLTTAQAENAALRDAAERELAFWDRDGKPCECGTCAVCGLRKATLSSTSASAFMARLAELEKELAEKWDWLEASRAESKDARTERDQLQSDLDKALAQLVTAKEGQVTSETTAESSPA